MLFFFSPSPSLLQSKAGVRSPTRTNVWHLEPALVSLGSRHRTLWMWCDAACRLQESRGTRTAPSWAPWGRLCLRRELYVDSTKVSAWTGSRGPLRSESASPPSTSLRSCWGSCTRWATQLDNSYREKWKTRITGWRDPRRPCEENQRKWESEEFKHTDSDPMGVANARWRFICVRYVTWYRVPVQTLVMYV